MSGTGELIALFRPVGLAELGLIFDSRMKEFPPRLPEQPIFYPVMNQGYASEIASKWNAQSAPDFAGYVTTFNLTRNYAAQFPVRTVGNSTHEELWVPAEKLDEFNSQIVGCIQTIEAYFDAKFAGFIPDNFGLRDKNATEQFVCLATSLDYSGMDFICEISANSKAVFINYPFWAYRDFDAQGISKDKKQRVLDMIVKVWEPRFPEFPLCSHQSNLL
jgi:hypothetical protein